MTDDTRRLEGVCVLILEDDYYLATDLQDTLEAAGARVLGPFACVATAADALGAGWPDCALLDLNLGQGISLDLPRMLARRAIPFAFVTGYDRAAIPPEFASHARAEKPIAVGRAVQLVVEMCGVRTSAG
jgi:DNA-binding NtrC family response regulator